MAKRTQVSEVRKSVSRQLAKLYVVVVKLRQKQVPKRTEELAREWERLRDSFENGTLRSLPRFIREEIWSHDELRDARVIRFKPVAGAKLKNLSAWEETGIREGGGYLRCTRWDEVHCRLVEVHSKSKDPEWEIEWPDFKAAHKRASVVFNQFEATRKTLEPTVADLKQRAIEVVSKETREWWPDGVGMDQEQFQLARRSGTLQVPEILSDAGLRSALKEHVEPFPVADLIESALFELMNEGQLRQTEYRHADEPDERMFWYLPGENSTAEKPVWDEVSGDLRWQGRIVKHLTGQAKKPRRVLHTFQANGWQKKTEDPVSDDGLHDTIKNLNRGLGGIRFGLDAGRVHWFPAPEK